MKDIKLENGQILLFRTNATNPRHPLWAGRARSKAGVTANVSLWKRAARDTGLIYLGGTLTAVDSNPDVYHVAENGNGKGDIAVFGNDKADNPKRPDMRGQATYIDGSRQLVSLWKKDGQSGLFLAGQIEDERDLNEQGKDATDDVAPE